MEHKKISKSLDMHWRAVEVERQLYPCFMAVQGSQNYGLDWDESDVDTKCWVIPTLKEMSFNSRPISETYVLKNDEHADIKDIRLYFGEFWKQNPNFLEVLFSPYVMMTKDFTPYYDRLVELRERIAHYDNYKMVNTLGGMAQQKFNQMFKVRPGNQVSFDRVGYDVKDLCHLLRVEEMLKNFCEDISFKESLGRFSTYGKIFLVGIKQFNVELPEAKKLAEEALRKINLYIQEYRQNHFYRVDNDVRVKVEDLLFDVIKEEVRKEGLWS